MSTIRLPHMIKNFNLFIDGQGYAGVLTEVVLPKLTKKTEEFRGAGMDVAIEYDMGMEVPTLEMTAAEIDPYLLESFGFTQGRQVAFHITALGEDGDGGEMALEIHCRGIIKELDCGTLKPGEKTEMKATATLRYCKYVVDGKERIVVDAHGGNRTSAGNNYMGRVKAILGLV